MCHIFKTKAVTKKTHLWDLPGHLNCHILTETLHVYRWIYLRPNVVRCDGQTFWHLSFHTLRRLPKTAWHQSTRTATWCGFSSTSRSLGWMSAPSCLLLTPTGTSAQQRLTTCQWRCARSPPAATEPSPSVQSRRRHPQRKVDLHLRAQRWSS